MAQIEYDRPTEPQTCLCLGVRRLLIMNFTLRSGFRTLHLVLVKLHVIAFHLQAAKHRRHELFVLVACIPCNCDVDILYCTGSAEFNEEDMTAC